MDWVIAECYYRGIKVILDYHRIHNTNDNELGLWWDLSSTAHRLGPRNWAMLAKRYKGNPTVIGVSGSPPSSLILLSLIPVSPQ